MPLVNKTFSDIITFSRGSNATMFDSSGTLVYAPNNLLTYSEELDNAAWTKNDATISANSIIAPTGLLSADKIDEDNSTSSHRVISIAPTWPSSTACTFSFFAKSGERSQVYGLLGTTIVASRLLVIFNLATGVATTSSGSPLATAMTSVGNGWYRCSITFTSIASPTGGAVIGIWNGSEVYTGVTGDGLYVWGAQLNIENMQGGVTGSLSTYYPTTSAAYYGPRLDYDPATLAARGLLIEEQRTNLFPASNDFANATYWTAYGTAVATAGSGIGPDGLNSAVNLVGATDTTLNGNNIEESVTVSASTAYEFSVFVKSNGGTTVTLRLRDSTGGSTSSTAFNVTSTWTRISLNRTMDAGATSVRCIIGLTDGNIFIYGAQLEAGAFPTSYIPTTTTALTRSADVASVNTLSPWYNQTEGTFFTQFSRRNIAVGNTFGQDTTTSNNGYGVTRGLTGIVSALNADGVTNITLGTSSADIDNVALGYSSAGFSGSWNGAAAVVSTAAPTRTPISLILGNNRAGTSNINGYLRRITYYPRRLSNAELVSITS